MPRKPIYKKSEKAMKKTEVLIISVVLGIILTLVIIAVKDGIECDAIIINNPHVCGNENHVSSIKPIQNNGQLECHYTCEPDTPEPILVRDKP